MEEDEYNDIVTYKVKKVPVSLYCSFLIVPSVFSNVYFLYSILPVEKL